MSSTTTQSLKPRSASRRRRLGALLSLGLAAFGVAGGVVCIGAALGLAPEPDPIPRRWQLTLEPGPMRVATIDFAGKGPMNYFYFTYKVTNNSGGDLLFAPSIELATNLGEVTRSGRDVPAEVTRQILQSLGNPNLEDQISIVGLLLQGEGNAKEGLAIWPVAALRIDDLALYAAGFSGETKSDEIHSLQTGKPTKVTLRKTYMVRYQCSGEIRDQGTRAFDVKEQRWIMR